MPKYSWDKPAAPGGGLAAPLLLGADGSGASSRSERSEGERFGLRSAADWQASLVKDCPSDEIEWPQYEILEARGCCDRFLKFHRYIWCVRSCSHGLRCALCCTPRPPGRILGPVLTDRAHTGSCGSTP